MIRERFNELTVAIAEGWKRAYQAAVRTFRRSSVSSPERTGARGEKAAADFLRRKGYRIIEHGRLNWLGEIDLIAVDESDRRRRVIVFVEVKTWSKTGEGGPSDAVDDLKQQRLTRLALEYLKSHHLLEAAARFDVVEVILETKTIRHFPNAFEATGKYQWFS